MPADKARMFLYDFSPDVLLTASVRDVYACAMIKLVANHTALSSHTSEAYLMGPSRGRKILARARQKSQYLMNIVFAMDYTQIGKYTKRDRTSVAHACGVIEESRDNLVVDKSLFFTEMALQAMAQVSWGEDYLAAGEQK